MGVNLGFPISIGLLAIVVSAEFSTLDGSSGDRGAVFIPRFDMFTAEAHTLVSVASPFPYPVKMDWKQLDNLVSNISDDMINIRDYYEREMMRVMENGYWATEKYRHYMPVFRCKESCQSVIPEAIIQEMKRLLTEIKDEAELANTLLNNTKIEAVSFKVDVPAMNVMSDGTQEAEDELVRKRRGYLAPLGFLGAGVGFGAFSGIMLKKGVCGALPSVFNFCEDSNKKLTKRMNSVIATQRRMSDYIQRETTENNEKFFLLGNEIARTQADLQEVKEKAILDQEIMFGKIEKMRKTLSAMELCSRWAHNISRWEASATLKLESLRQISSQMKIFRVGIESYRRFLFSALDSLSQSYLHPSLVTPAQITSIVDEVHTFERSVRHTRLQPAIATSQVPIYYRFPLVERVAFADEAIIVFFQIPLNYAHNVYRVYEARPLMQPNWGEDTATTFRFPKPYLAIAGGGTSYAELGREQVDACVGTAELRLCPQHFISVTDRSKLCLSSLYYNSDIAAIQTCDIETVPLQDNPKSEVIEPGVYQLITSQENLKLHNLTSDGAMVGEIYVNKTSIIKPACGHRIETGGTLRLSPDFQSCQTDDKPFVSTVTLTPPLQSILSQLPSAHELTKFNSIREAREQLIAEVRSHLKGQVVHHMSTQDLRTLTRPIATQLTMLHPQIQREIDSRLPTSTALLMALCSMTLSVIYGLIAFTYFRKQLRVIFTHPVIAMKRHVEGSMLMIVDTEAELLLPNDAHAGVDTLTRRQLDAIRSVAVSMESPEIREKFMSGMQLVVNQGRSNLPNLPAYEPNPVQETSLYAEPGLQPMYPNPRD